MLELSCTDDSNLTTTITKLLKNQLIDDGMDENEAIDKALQIDMLSLTDNDNNNDDGNDGFCTRKLPPGPLNGVFHAVSTSTTATPNSTINNSSCTSTTTTTIDRTSNDQSINVLKTILTTLSRDTDNVLNAPRTTKF
jgi:hypothetical protein